MKPHPLSVSFPPMSDADFASLSTDIAAHGLREPITTYDGMVLDGWHRYQVCAELNIKPKLVPFTGDDPASFVLSKNLHRRHLSASQRAVAVAACREWAPNGIKVANISHLASTAEMAREANVSPQTIKDAKTAIKTGQAADVTAGKISVSKAAEKAKPKPEREPDPEPEDSPDIAAEFEALSAENDKLQKLNESLLQDDTKKEIVTWKGKFDALNGRVQQLLTTEAEMRRQLNYQTKILTTVRGLLGVEKSSQIVNALKEALEK